MVPKHGATTLNLHTGFRAVLFRMVPKHKLDEKRIEYRFRAVLFRMVPKQIKSHTNV